MQMSKTYSIETAAVQYYLLWRTSHGVQFCWVFQQAACWTKNQMKCKYAVVDFERLAPCGDLKVVNILCSAFIDISHMTGIIMWKGNLKN